MEDNLRSFFELDYPIYELVFSVADGDDPALGLVTKLQNEYPHIQSRVYVGARDVGVNPKINNLMCAYESASYDWVLISDSNVRVAKSELKHLVSHLGNNVGMVTCVVSGRNQQSLGAWLESVFLNTYLARGMVLADIAGKPCVVGKAMLFQRSVAKRFGGIQTLGCYLAEDYMAGKAIESLGMKVVIASNTVGQFLGEYSVHEFWSRHVRWGRIRKAQAPLAFWIEPAFSVLGQAVFGGVALSWLLGANPLAIFSIQLIASLLCDWMVWERIANTPRVSFTMIPFWFFRECLALPLWAHIACGDTVLWRGKRYRISFGGLLESL